MNDTIINPYPVEDWQFTPPPGDTWQEGDNFIARIETQDGRFWAKMVVTVTERGLCEDGDVYYSFRFDTCLDGSPGFMDGWDGRE